MVRSLHALLPREAQHAAERNEHYATHGKGKREAMERRLPGSFESGKKR
jgi:hypothetical protein